MKSKFPIYLSGERIFSNSEKAISLQETKKLGELKEGKVIYSSFEALYIIEKHVARFISLNKSKEFSENELISLLSKKDKGFHTKFIIFKYLKNKSNVIAGRACPRCDSLYTVGPHT